MLKEWDIAIVFYAYWTILFYLFWKLDFDDFKKITDTINKAVPD